MSASKSVSNIHRRLALLAGGSMATVLAAGAGGLVLVPSTALAADECGPPTGVQTCSGTHASIDYPLTTGNLTLNLANDLNVTAGGMSVNGTGANSVTIGRTNTGSATLDPVITSTSDAGIAVNNATGAITVNLTDPAFATGPGIAVTGATHGLQLATGSTGGISVTQTNGSITATGPSGIGIRTATTSLTGGNTTLNIGGLVTGATGIQATSTGTGSMTVNVNAAADTVAGGQVVGAGGPAILLSPNAGATITMGAGTTVRANGGANAVVDVTSLNGALTFTNLGELRSNDTTEGGHDDLIFRVGGGAGSVTMTNGQIANPGICFGTPPTCFGVLPAIDVDLNGRIDLGNTGSTVLNLRSATVWRTAGANLLGNGATTLTHDAAATIIAGVNGVATQLDFGGGADTYNQAGILIMGGGTEAANTLTLSNLEFWNSSNLVLFGANADNTASDGAANDRIAATGPVTFTGSGLSRLALDVNLGGTAQASCAAAVVADCLDLTGGTTAGSTVITVNNVGAGIGASNTGIVLVDVSGGTSAAENFTLSPDSPGWRSVEGTDGVIDGGMFVYGLTYDEATQRHMLVSSPDTEGLEFATFGAAVRSVWETSADSSSVRQADVRDTLEDGRPGFGLWLKATGNFVERTLYQAYDFNGGAFEFNNGYSQETMAVVGGVDFVNVVAGAQAWLAGVTVGRTTSDLEFTTSPTTVRMEGYSVGGYASYVAGMFFVDALVNGHRLDLEYDGPSIGITGVTGEATSLGYRAEAGMRLPINDGQAYLEPLLALSHVTTSFDEVALPGVTIGYEDMTSFRGAVGLRLVGSLPLEAITSRFAFTGRVWEEFDGENEAVISSGGVDFAQIDDTTGTLGDIGVTLSVGGADGRVLAFAGYGVKFKQDYRSTDASIGFRYQW